MNKRLFATASAAPFMGFDGCTSMILPHARNRMRFAPETGEGTGNEQGKTGTGRIQEALNQQQEDEKNKNNNPGKDDKNKPGKTQETPADDSKLVQEVMKWKTKARETEEKLRQFDGLDPEEIRKLVEESKTAEERRLRAEQAAEEERARASGDFDKLKEKMAKEHAKQMDALQKQLKERDERELSLSSKIADLTIGNAFNNSSFVRSNLTLPPSKARVIYGSYFDLNEDGEVVGYDKPRGKADRQPLVDASGTPVSFDEAFKQIIEADPDKDDLLRSTVKQGTGTRPAGVNAPLNQDKTLSRTALIAKGLSELKK